MKPFTIEPNMISSNEEKKLLIQIKLLFPPRIELGTFCVLGRRDNRYTTET